MLARPLSTRTLAAALAVACLSLAGCREHNEPVKPIAPAPVTGAATGPAQPA